MTYELLDYLLIAFDVALLVAVLVKFRGIPALLGGLGFGILLVVSMLRQWSPSALNDYNLLMTFVSLAGSGCMIGAFAVVPVESGVRRVFAGHTGASPS